MLDPSSAEGAKLVQMVRDRSFAPPSLRIDGQEVVMLERAATTSNTLGSWRAVFVGPMGPRPQMVDAVTFAIRSTPKGLVATARAEPEWPGELVVSDLKVDGDHISFAGTGQEGSSVKRRLFVLPETALRRHGQGRRDDTDDDVDVI